MRTAFPSRGSLPGAWSVAAAVLVAVTVLGAGFFERLPDLCGFHRLTGLPCPTCGLTRSLASAGRLDWAAAWRFHPFGPFLLAALILAPVWRRVVPETVRMDPRWRWAGGLLVAVWCAFAGLRMGGLLPPP